MLIWLLKITNLAVQCNANQVEEDYKSGWANVMLIWLLRIVHLAGKSNVNQVVEN